MIKATNLDEPDRMHATACLSRASVYPEAELKGIIAMVVPAIT